MYPSQNSGGVHLLGFSTAFKIAGKSRPTKWLVPFSIVIGLSVFSRIVMQGILQNVVSSCMPPESVTTNFDSAISFWKSKYPNGSVITTPFIPFSLS